MQFGPFFLELERIKIKDLQVYLTSKINHFWGENGVGKSTLMNLLIKQLEKEKTTFCYINQNYRLNWFWWLSVRQNLELAMKASNKYYNYKKIEDTKDFLANKSWLAPLLEIDSRQINFNTQNELDSIGLSGGQLQRVLLFRELLLKPKFVFLDEAFSALDKKVVTEITNWLLQEQKNNNFDIISISHDLEIIKQLPGDIFQLTKDNDNFLKINKTNVVL